MSSSIQSQSPVKKSAPSKIIPQILTQPKTQTQPSGLSREELRLIVLEMIG